jgi:hypothetical protein
LASSSTVGSNTTALLDNNFEVKWVLSQVGHANSKMTVDVDAQLEQRVKRDRCASFDRLVRQAHELREDGSAAGEACQLVLKRLLGIESRRFSRSPDTSVGAGKSP